MGDLDAETSKNVCDSLGKTFGVGEDDKTNDSVETKTNSWSLAFRAR